MTTSNSRKNVSDSFIHQIRVLKAMSKKNIANNAIQIEEIAELSGLRDEKETQRYLFILEGQKLVSPQPAGDFTSKSWSITSDGLQVVKKAARTSLVA